MYIICFAYTLYYLSIVLLDNYSLRSCSLRSRYLLYIYITYLILFLKDLSLYTVFLGQSRQIFSKKIVTSLLINHLALKIFVVIISVKDAKEHKMVSLVGVIRKPSTWVSGPSKESMDSLDGRRVVVELGKITDHYPGNTGLVEPQSILFITDGVAINIKWIHEMEFVYD